MVTIERLKPIAKLVAAMLGAPFVIITADLGNDSAPVTTDNID